MEMELEVRGQKVVLLPEKLVHLPSRDTLLVTDTHFGKAASFRKAGIPVPGGTTQYMLESLSRVIGHLAVKRLIVLGDFVHSATRSETDFEYELVAWRARHPGLELTLVAGNHDRGHKELFAELRMQVVQEPLVVPPFAFCHFHEANSDRELYTFAGHIHPAIRMPGLPEVAEKIPCFASSETKTILPAFGEFTGTAIVSRKEFPNLYGVADDQVIEIPHLDTTDRQSHHRPRP